jgi:hypothetical protein
MFLRHDIGEGEYVQINFSLVTHLEYRLAGGEPVIVVHFAGGGSYTLERPGATVVASLESQLRSMHEGP